MLRHLPLACILLALIAPLATADEVLFNNGDKLTGEILSADGGKLKIKTAVAGEVTVDMKDVATFRSDKPLQIRLQDKRIVRGVVASATTQPATTQQGAILTDGQTIPSPTSSASAPAESGPAPFSSTATSPAATRIR